MGEAKLIVALILTIFFPLLWLRAEFTDKRWFRITTGLLALGACYGVAALVGGVSGLFERISVGEAVKTLTTEASAQLKAGRTGPVLRELDRFSETYHPSYENFHLPQALRETARRMRHQTDGVTTATTPQPAMARPVVGPLRQDRAQGELQAQFTSPKTP